MTGFRRFALFQLSAAGLTTVAVVSLYVWSGNVTASLAGFAFLALPGFRAALLRGKTPVPLQDERDDAIRHRATVAGYVALWLALVIWGTAMPLVFADRGTVPLAWVAPVVWVAWWLVTCVQSITILVLDSRGT